MTVKKVTTARVEPTSLLRPMVLQGVFVQLEVCARKELAYLETAQRELLTTLQGREAQLNVTHVHLGSTAPVPTHRLLMVIAKPVTSALRGQKPMKVSFLLQQLQLKQQQGSTHLLEPLRRYRVLLDHSLMPLGLLLAHFALKESTVRNNNVTRMVSNVLRVNIVILDQLCRSYVHQGHTMIKKKQKRLISALLVTQDTTAMKLAFKHPRENVQQGSYAMKAHGINTQSLR